MTCGSWSLLIPTPDEFPTPWHESFREFGPVAMAIAPGRICIKHVYGGGIHIGVSKNRGGFYPQIIHFNRVWNHYKPSILGYHYFWKHPCMFQKKTLKKQYDIIMNIIWRVINPHLIATLCSSFSRENGHPLLISSSLSTA